MYWTLELATQLTDAPWPSTKAELIEFAMRSGKPIQLIEILQQLDEESEAFERIEDVWPDFPRKSDFYYDEYN